MIYNYINTNLIFDVGTNKNHRVTVVKRSQGIDGRATGHVHTNPLFDTSEYETEFTHGTRDKYTAI